MGMWLQWSLYSHYIPTILLGSPVWGSHLTPFNRVGGGGSKTRSPHLTGEHRKAKSEKGSATTSALPSKASNTKSGKVVGGLESQFVCLK